MVEKHIHVSLALAETARSCFHWHGVIVPAEPTGRLPEGSELASAWI
ncbi:hypothetical protein SynBMKMC1_01942 [Synechococcus sp. BMK-MC-1]|nr:hypothetical protein SynBMKMC1_01942 [Synechococcus sp. BMK-MC-1]